MPGLPQRVGESAGEQIAAHVGHARHPLGRHSQPFGESRGERRGWLRWKHDVDVVQRESRVAEEFGDGKGDHVEVVRFDVRCALDAEVCAALVPCAVRRRSVNVLRHAIEREVRETGRARLCAFQESAPLKTSKARTRRRPPSPEAAPLPRPRAPARRAATAGSQTKSVRWTPA
jgi:hypothetical protein